MPNVDAWAAIRELQHDTKTASIPVIALTGHDLKDYLKYSAMVEGAVSPFVASRYSVGGADLNFRRPLL